MAPEMSAKAVSVKPMGMAWAMAISANLIRQTSEITAKMASVRYSANEALAAGT
jgi:hypothetical protein